MILGRDWRPWKITLLRSPCPGEEPQERGTTAGGAAAPERRGTGEASRWLQHHLPAKSRAWRCREDLFSVLGGGRTLTVHDSGWKGSIPMSTHLPWPSRATPLSPAQPRGLSDKKPDTSLSCSKNHGWKKKKNLSAKLHFYFFRCGIYFDVL